MARFTKDFKKELRRITDGPEKGRFGWVELTAEEQERARRIGRTPKVGGGTQEKSRRWFRKPETGKGGPEKSAQAPSGGQGTTGPQTNPQAKERNKGAEAFEGTLAVGAKFDLKSFGHQIVGAHEMLALVAKNPVWRITQDQGEKLAQALSDVSAQYSIRVNPKTLAWLKLAGVVAAVEGPKLWLIANTPKKPKADADPLGADVLGAGNATRTYQ